MNQNHVIDGWLAQLRFDSRSASAEQAGLTATVAHADGDAPYAPAFAAQATSRAVLDARPRRRLRGAGAVRPCVSFG